MTIARACARPSRGAARATGVTCGRRSSAQKRAKISRASGPAIVSARSREVTSRTSTIVGAASSVAVRLADDERAGSRVSGHHQAPSRRVAVPSRQLPERVELALELELAQVRDVGEADGAGRRPLARPRSATATFQPSRTSKRRAGGRAPAAPSASCATARRRPPARRNVEAHERSTSPRGRRTGLVWTSAVERAALVGDRDAARRPAPAPPAPTPSRSRWPSCGEWRALVTWPAGAPRSSRTTAPSVGTSPLGSVKPTSAVAGSVRRRRARAPTCR